MEFFDFSFFVLGGLALVALAVATHQGEGHVGQGFRASGGLVSTMIVRLPLGLILAGFLGTLVPNDAVAAWMGNEAGWKGILIASAIGGFTPSGPFVSFPVALALHKAGAGLPQVIAFVTAWSVYGFNRVITWEWPLLGMRFVIVRLLLSLPIPPLAGWLAGLYFGL